MKYPESWSGETVATDEQKLRDEVEDSLQGRISRLESNRLLAVIARERAAGRAEGIREMLKALEFLPLYIPNMEKSPMEWNKFVPEILANQLIEKK